MDISFNELRSKEIVNLSDGSRMGHVIDLLFNTETGVVLGLMVPGEKKLFKKSEDFFIPFPLTLRMTLHNSIISSIIIHTSSYPLKFTLFISLKSLFAVKSLP